MCVPHVYPLYPLYDLLIIMCHVRMSKIYARKCNACIWLRVTVREDLVPFWFFNSRPTANKLRECRQQ